MQSAGLSNFAWGHTCSRQDTLSGLAVKYGVTPLAIKMTNNLISDMGLQSRHTVYVPGIARLIPYHLLCAANAQQLH